MSSSSAIRSRPGTAAARAAFALAATLAMLACHDAVAPRPPGPAIRIVSLLDSVFEGDTVRLAAQVFDESGAADTTAPVTWMVSDTTLAKVVGEGRFALLQPGTVLITARSGAATTSDPLVIGRVVVQRVEVTPAIVDMGRTDRLTVTARVLGQGDRAITGRTVTFTSDDTLVAIIPGPASITSPNTGLLIALGPGSTAIRASVDGVFGTALVQVVVVDTTSALTQYNGSPIPVLIEADTLLIDGVEQVYEIYADSGTLVLSGLLQKRYQLDVRYSVYQVIQRENTVEREFRFQVRGQFDRGLVTVGANGSLSMLSEIIGPHLEHTATRQSEGYLVHYRIPGENSFLDLQYRRVTP